MAGPVGGDVQQGPVTVADKPRGGQGRAFDENLLQRLGIARSDGCDGGHFFGSVASHCGFAGAELLHLHDLTGGDGEASRAGVAGQVGGDDEGVVIDLFDPACFGLMAGCLRSCKSSKTWSRPVQSKGSGSGPRRVTFGASNVCRVSRSPAIQAWRPVSRPACAASSFMTGQPPPSVLRLGGWPG